MITYLEPTDPELQRAWLTFDDPVTLYNGETWQYMGSEFTNDTWVHCFRHRAHPDGVGRKYIRVPALPNWEPTTQNE